MNDDRAPTETGDEQASPTESGSREVVVPLAVYKTVTVFSTLIAVVAVVLGFVLLDAATQSGGLIRFLVGGLLRLVGRGVPPARLTGLFDTLAPVFALLGLGSVALGAGVYVLGSRFRTEGMGANGNAQDANDEPPNDG